MRDAQTGVNLLETMLVLVIAGTILVFGLRQYQLYRVEQSFEQVKYNVDQLFLAAAHFYQANCSAEKVLDPNFTPPPSNPYPLDISKDLQTPGFLLNWQPLNELIDDTAAGQGYVVQLNSSTATRNIYACWNFDTPTCTLPQSIQSNQKTIILWRIQIAVKLKNAANIRTYQSPLLADCVSDTATACKQDAANPTYLIWQRLPSFASPKTRTSLWVTMPVLKVFNLQYTHDQMYEFQNETYAESQNYLCGG